jgi:[ribosomal protein S5]-alanine N-acetyltransferase
MIFETQRLYTRRLEKSDEVPFFELMGNPNVMDPIPQKPLSRSESASKLAELMLLEGSSSTKIWALCRKESNDLIGICGVLKNNEGNDEIAYRIIEKFWGQGYGTEITKGLIDFCFFQMRSDLVTVDVYVDNVRSVKILEKFFTAEKEFFNPEDNCTDRRYTLRREQWAK